MNLLFIIPFALSSPEEVGNCQSQRLNFDPDRMFALDGMDSMRHIPELDVSRYDLTIDYHKENVKKLPDGGVEIFLTKPDMLEQNPFGTRLGTTRFIHYGKISAYFKTPAVSGAVTTFITMAPQLPDEELDLSTANPYGGDEIDWEVLGIEPHEAQTNIFYRGIPEYGIRGRIHAVPSGIEEFHKYTIDWKRDNITFLLDDKVVRVYHRQSQEADSVSMSTNRKFFPDRPSKVQFALWSENKNIWAGGPIQWAPGQTSLNATYLYIDVQCYDDQDKPVAKWPLQNNPDYKPSIKGQPTEGVKGKIPFEAHPDFNGVIQNPNIAIPKDPVFNSSGFRLTCEFAFNYVFTVIAYLGF